MGKLIVIEGVDSSGKATQTQLLVNRLKNDGFSPMQITFPDYESDFSIPVKKYLAGDLGKEADSVSPYGASLLYAIDRYASYIRTWGEFYKSGGTVIADRYVTSNIVHQASKLSGNEKLEFIKWLSDVEYEKLALPKPDIVIFLDMPPKYAQMLMAHRKNKITGGNQKDIHESDSSYITRSYENAISVCSLCGWEKISCIKDGKMRTRGEIAEEIYKKTKIIF